MKVNVYVKEINYGIISLEVDDTKEGWEDKMYEKVYDMYGEGRTNWGDIDFQIEDWEEDSVA